MDELIGEFVGETAESLDTIDSELVKFETDPTDRATLDNIFRLMHTIKGTCGFLGLGRLEALAHAGETLLNKFRDGDMRADSAAVTLVLQSVDRTKLILNGLEETGNEPAGDDRDLIDQLEAMAMGEMGLQPLAPPEPDPEPEPEPEPVLADAETGAEGERFDADLGRPLRPGEVSLAELEAAFLAAESPFEAVAGDDEPDADEADIEPVAPPPLALDAAAAPADADAPREVRAPAAIRVSVEVLENLMTTVSELVLARNQLHQIVRETSDPALKTPLQRLSSVTAELQDGVMKTRMQPVGDAWRKLPRIVRDVQQDVGKKIRLVMEGEDTELDRQVLELIKDPLTHMVRNSADHGLEAPDIRAAAGKPETGTIRLSACHEGGAIIIRISDDGAGIDPAKIRAKAIEKGLVAAPDATAMSEAQILRFIFAPGFSTAAKVTNLSGRGVGMDVVRTNIEQIGGSIDLSSDLGKGTVFSIKIPLTLAIVSALIVKAGEQRFAVPQLSVRELVRVGEGADHAIETLNGARMIRLRERLLPVVSVHTVLGDESQADAAGPMQGYVVVLEAAGRRIGLVVDDVLDTEEIVVKPLSAQLRAIPVYSGATILGDGAVIMIFDPNGVAHEIAHTEEESVSEARAEARIADPTRQRLLLVRAGGDEPKAAPVSLITRLEEFDAAAIERVDGRMVTQYRGRLLPLAHAGGEFPKTGRVPVLVFTEEDRWAGVAVDAILDVVEDSVDLQLGSDRPGVIGSAILQGRATEMLDIGWHMERAWRGGAPRGSSRVRKSVLLVEADAFARRMMAPLLAAAGYDVTVASGMNEARDAAQMGARYDALVGDPAALAQLKADGFWPDAPRLGISEQTGAGGVFEGLAGVTRPGDRGELIAALDRASQDRVAETRAA